MSVSERVANGEITTLCRSVVGTDNTSCIASIKSVDVRVSETTNAAKLSNSRVLATRINTIISDPSTYLSGGGATLRQ